MLFDEQGKVIPGAEAQEKWGGAEERNGPQDFEDIAKQEIAKARTVPVNNMMGQSRPLSRLSQLQQFSNQAGKSWDQNKIGQEEYYSGPLAKGGNRKSSVIDRTGEKGEMYTAGGYQLPQEDSWEFARSADGGDLNRLGYNPFRS